MASSPPQQDGAMQDEGMQDEGMRDGAMHGGAGTLWTIGHSTREWADFLALLHEAQIQ
jgi:hypothetical protein